MAIETITILDATGVERSVYADAISSAFAQVLKLAWGADGVLTLADASNPLPVTDAGGATQTTLAAILAKIIASPATEATLTTVRDKSADVAATLTSGRKTSSIVGTAVALRSTLACKWVQVTALVTNTTRVYVGGTGTLATAGSQTGTPLAAGESVTIPVADAASILLDVLTSGEGVSFLVGA
jgi:hypothetical protein